MKTVKMTELNEAVRQFLDQAKDEDAIRVEDDSGKPRYTVARFYRATEEERAAALARLAEVQKNIRRRMEAAGKTEEELDRILREDE